MKYSTSIKPTFPGSLLLPGPDRRRLRSHRPIVPSDGTEEEEEGSLNFLLSQFRERGRHLRQWDK